MIVGCGIPVAGHSKYILRPSIANGLLIRFDLSIFGGIKIFNIKSISVWPAILDARHMYLPPSFKFASTIIIF